jgi:hypothetical protein
MMLLHLFKDKIAELLSLLKKTEKLNYTYTYPYSSNKEIKRQQIWSNLQKGLLLEDKGVFIPWNTPFNKLGKYKEQRRNSGGRINWYLGKHNILDGEECHLETMKYVFWLWHYPITEITENIGYDEEGMKRFHHLKNHIIDLLGEPTKTDLEKFGNFDLGGIEWVNNKVKISLVGVEVFNCRYSLNIGLVEDKNRIYEEEQFEKLKAKLFAQGLTEEDLGK